MPANYHGDRSFSLDMNQEFAPGKTGSSGSLDPAIDRHVDGLATSFSVVAFSLDPAIDRHVDGLATSFSVVALCTSSTRVLAPSLFMMFAR